MTRALHQAHSLVDSLRGRACSLLQNNEILLRNELFEMRRRQSQWQCVARDMKNTCLYLKAYLLGRCCLTPEAQSVHCWLENLYVGALLERPAKFSDISSKNSNEAPCLLKHVDKIMMTYLQSFLQICRSKTQSQWKLQFVHGFDLAHLHPDTFVT